MFTCILPKKQLSFRYFDIFLNLNIQVIVRSTIDPDNNFFENS